jgi:hypothetical protein
MYEEELLVNGQAGNEVLTKQERQTLKREAGELKQRIEQAKQEPIKE